MLAFNVGENPGRNAIVQFLEITCITKPNPFDPWKRIEAVGGAGFMYDLDTAVRLALAGQVKFRVREGVHLVDVEVVPGGVFGRPYLRTAPNGTPVDNLLHLPQCGLRALLDVGRSNPRAVL